MAGWGGPRPGSGRKPGQKSTLNERRLTAGAILASIDEMAFWLEMLRATRVIVAGSDGEYQQITVPDYQTRMDAAKFLTTQRDGRAYQQINPLQAQRLSAGDDPKLAAVLQNLLPQPGATVTLTEKQIRIDPNVQALENVNTEAKAKLPAGEPQDLVAMPLTVDASATLPDDPSGRKAGVGHFGAESHTERNQIPEKSRKLREKPEMAETKKKPSDADREKTRALRGWAKGIEQP